MIADSVRPSGYRISLAYAAAEGVGHRISHLLVVFFAWVDRCLRASLFVRASSAIAGTWSRAASGSVFVGALWPFAKMALVPYGGQVSVETALGLVLALACVAPTEILIVAASGVFLLFLWDRARKVRDGRAHALWALPGFGTVLAVASVLTFIVGATVSSVDPSKSLFNMVIWFFYFLVFFMAADASFRGQAENVIWPLLTGAAFSGLVSVYQKLTGWLPPKSWVDVSFEGDIVRMVGTFSNPTFFAEMMGLALPLTIALILSKKDWRDRIVLLGFAAFQGIGLVLSSSRGAWLGFAVSFCVLAVLYDWRMLPLGLVAGGLGLAVAPPVLLKRLVSSFSLTDSSNAYRVFIWRGSLAMLKDNLLRGIGLGAESFSKVYPEYMIIQTPAPHAHSTFLEFLIEVGLFGFLAMACLFLVWAYDAFKVMFAEKGKGSARWNEVVVLSAAVAAVGGHMLQGVIDYTWYSPKITAIFWAIVGIGAGITASKPGGGKYSMGG